MTQLRVDGHPAEGHEMHEKDITMMQASLHALTITVAALLTELGRQADCQTAARTAKIRALRQVAAVHRRNPTAMDDPVQELIEALFANVTLDS